jgi:hypothetical protein
MDPLDKRYGKIGSWFIKNFVAPAYHEADGKLTYQEIINNFLKVSTRRIVWKRTTRRFSAFPGRLLEVQWKAPEGLRIKLMRKVRPKPWKDSRFSRARAVNTGTLLCVRRDLDEAFVDIDVHGTLVDDRPACFTFRVDVEVFSDKILPFLE